MLLLGEAHRLSRACLGNLALTRRLRVRLDLLFKLLRIGRNELGKGVTHTGLRRGIDDRRSRSCRNLGPHRRRNNGRKAGVVDHPLRQFLVGTDPHHGLVDRGRLQPTAYFGVSFSRNSGS